jgi:hypothetical protein
MTTAVARQRGLDEVDHCGSDFRCRFLKVRRMISVGHDDPTPFRSGQLTEESRCDSRIKSGISRSVNQ